MGERKAADEAGVVDTRMEEPEALSGKEMIARDHVFGSERGHAELPGLRAATDADPTLFFSSPSKQE